MKCMKILTRLFVLLLTASSSVFAQDHDYFNSTKTPITLG